MAYRAYSLHLDGVTGSTVFDATTGARVAGPPAVEKFARWLATPRGRAGRNRLYGLDLSDVDNATPNAAAVVAQRIRAGAKAQFGASIVIVSVRVEVYGTALLARVDVRDPLDPQAGVYTAARSF